MNRKFRVITINGIKGVFVAIFIVLGLIAGFIISPGWVCMTVWNYFLFESYNMPAMNLLQGVMLWTIIALILYALNNNKTLIGFGSYPSLSPEQIKDIMNKAKKEENIILKRLEERIKEANKDVQTETISENKKEELSKEEIK